jgi:hypothetical protein
MAPRRSRADSLRRLLVAGLAAASLALAAPAHAGRYDVIMMDRPLFLLCQGCGLVLEGADFALIANTGTEDIPDADLLNVTFSVTSSAHQIEVAAFPNEFRPIVGPVRPQEVVGRVEPINQVLLQHVAPGETHRNAGPLFGFLIYANEEYNGIAILEVTMRIGDHEYTHSIVAEVRPSFFADLTIRSATRGSAVPIPTPAAKTTWGAIKSTYR